MLDEFRNFKHKLACHYYDLHGIAIPDWPEIKVKLTKGSFSDQQSLHVYLPYCLFVLILHVPVNYFSVMLGQAHPGLNQY